jgi:hypothetical protein
LGSNRIHFLIILNYLFPGKVDNVILNQGPKIPKTLFLSRTETQEIFCLSVSAREGQYLYNSVCLSPIDSESAARMHFMHYAFLVMAFGQVDIPISLLDGLRGCLPCQM